MCLNYINTNSVFSKQRLYVYLEPWPLRKIKNNLCKFFKDGFLSLSRVIPNLLFQDILHSSLMHVKLEPVQTRTEIYPYLRFAIEWIILIIWRHNSMFLCTYIKPRLLQLQIMRDVKRDRFIWRLNTEFEWDIQISLSTGCCPSSELKQLAWQEVNHLDEQRIFNVSRWAVEPVLRARSWPGDPENWKRNSRQMQRGKPGRSNCYCWVNRIRIAYNAFPLVILLWNYILVQWISHLSLFYLKTVL